MDPIQPHLDEQRQRAFTKLWLGSQNALSGFVRVQIRDHTAANDIIQDVATKAAIHFDQYDPERPFVAWLIGIARNEIADAYRDQSRSPITFSTEAVERMLPALVAIQDNASERMDALRDCMASLNEKQLRLIDLRYSQHQSASDIAEAIGSTPSSINVMLFRIRDALRRCIRTKLGASS